MRPVLLLYVLMLLIPEVTWGGKLYLVRSNNYANLSKDACFETPLEENNKNEFVFSRISFSKMINEMAPISGYFDEMVEKKFLIFNDSYTEDVPLGPGSLSSKTVIRKPLIYSAINKIYKYYKSECKQGRITIDLAEKDCNFILDVGLNALYSDTADFEKALKEIKSMDEKIELFKSVRLID